MNRGVLHWEIGCSEVNMEQPLGVVGNWNYTYTPKLKVEGQIQLNALGRIPFQQNDCIIKCVD